MATRSRSDDQKAKKNIGTGRPIYCCHHRSQVMPSINSATQRPNSSTMFLMVFLPKRNLDDTFEQNNEIAKAVEQELEKTRPLADEVNLKIG
ncbi:hypothetical protein L2E82_01393 [Cichorium intybus]|uniref:Uncharacterized protein n=1 Tax=Cichorium intybus TaxID=13427 RepID=A0ACB9H010_CICIN|nr:hypothetical protein L2E82_01393 [Cichorium intybus]